MGKCNYSTGLTTVNSPAQCSSFSQFWCWRFSNFEMWHSVNGQEVSNVSKNCYVFIFRDGNTILWNVRNYLCHDIASQFRRAEHSARWCMVQSTISETLTGHTCTHTNGQAHKMLQATAVYKLQIRTLLKSTCFSDSHIHYSPKCRICYSTGHIHWREKLLGHKQKILVEQGWIRILWN
jgi:hypothetical protein